MKASVVTMTPEAALGFLSGNTNNRKKRGWWVQALSAAIKRGEWVTTHQGIAVSKSGVVLDGQHRLCAIVESGISVDILVVTDVPDDAFRVIDNGIKRSISDLTGMPKRTAEACRFFGTLIYNGNVSPQQVETIAQSGVAELHQKLDEACPTVRAFYSSTPIRCAAITLVLDGKPVNDVFSVFVNLIRDRFNELPAVAHALIRQFNSGKCTSKNTRDAYARALKALNPDCAELTKIQVSDPDIDSAVAYGKSVIRRAITAS